jgi:hypothetical protein
VKSLGLYLLALLSVGVLRCATAGADESQPTKRVRYSGTFGWFSEMPEGGPVCEFNQPDWETSGYLRLTEPLDKQLVVHEEALGCRLRLTTEDDKVFSASSTSCEWDRAVSLRELGVTERTFEHIRYDSISGELEAQGKSIRVTAGGDRMVLCFTLKVLVSNDSA